MSTTYTHVFWSTRIRREHLLATKYFQCSCDRCADPSELGSHLGTLKCPCGEGLVLAKDPLDEETEWSCTSCPGTLTSTEVTQLVERLGEEVDGAMGVASREVLTDLLSRYLDFYNFFSKLYYSLNDTFTHSVCQQLTDRPKQNKQFLLALMDNFCYENQSNLFNLLKCERAFNNYVFQCSFCLLSSLASITRCDCTLMSR